MALRGNLQNPADWARIGALLVAAPARMVAVVDAKLLAEAARLEGLIKIGIRNQAPGGKAFVPLKPATIRAKGSSKALIDSGSLLRAIKATRLKPLIVFVGVSRTVRSSTVKGSLIDIARVHEFGAKFSIISTRATIDIPARPYLRPVFEAERKNTFKAVEKALLGVFK